MKADKTATNTEVEWMGGSRGERGRFSLGDGNWFWAATAAVAKYPFLNENLSCK